MKNPCKKTCPKRSATCHGECGDYKDWLVFVEQRRNDNQKKVTLDGYFADIRNRKRKWFNNQLKK